MLTQTRAGLQQQPGAAQVVAAGVRVDVGGLGELGGGGVGAGAMMMIIISRTRRSLRCSVLNWRPGWTAWMT